MKSEKFTEQSIAKGTLHMNRLIMSNQKGTSLAELMIALALSTFVAITASLFLQSFTSLSLRAQKGDNIESNLDQMLRIVQNYTFFAVNVRYAGNTDLNSRRTGIGGQGYVRAIDITTNPGDDYTTLMYFARESSLSKWQPENSPALQSNFQSTAIFYRRRTTNTPPAVIIHPGRTGTGDLTATDNATIIYDYISDVRLDQPQINYDSSNLDVLTSIRFTAKAIYPTATTATKSTSDNEGECYGPTGDIATVCINSIPYAITQKAVILTFSNNKRHTFNSKNEFMNGVYLFRPVRGL